MHENTSQNYNVHSERDSIARISHTINLIFADMTNMHSTRVLFKMFEGPFLKHNYDYLDEIFQQIKIINAQDSSFAPKI